MAGRLAMAWAGWLPPGHGWLWPGLAGRCLYSVVRTSTEQTRLPRIRTACMHMIRIPEGQYSQYEKIHVFEFWNMIKSCQNVIITKSQRFESYFSKANVRSPILAKTHVWKSYFSNFLIKSI